MMSKAMNERLARAHEILSVNGRLRAQTVGDLAGWRHIPTCECDELVKLGLAVKLGATDGVCQSTYATVRLAKAERWI
jgi:hypothetical protein